MNDQAIFNHAKAFMKRYPWYKGPRSKDPDSIIVTRLDNFLTREAILDSSTPRYWAELERRIAVALPHRARPATDSGLLRVAKLPMGRS